MPSNSADNIPLPFGKYRGRTPNEIADGDEDTRPDKRYVIWLHDECVPQRVSRELYVACCDAIQK